MLERALVNARVPLDQNPTSIVGIDSYDRLWQAFCEFAAAPVDGLYPGLHVPGPGRSDLDTLTASIRPHDPPLLALTRQLYLVDADDEWQRIESAGVTLRADPIPDLRPAFIEGGGGPAHNTVGGAEAWIAEVEAHAAWRALRERAPNATLRWY